LRKAARNTPSLLGRRMQAHIPYRGILLSYAELVAASPDLQDFARRWDQSRSGRMQTVVTMLVDEGCLDPERLREGQDYLRRQLEAIGRLWLPRAILDGHGEDLVRASIEQAKLMLHLWSSYATEKGVAQIREILAEGVGDTL
jgi:hypothetical protein